MDLFEYAQKEHQPLALKMRPKKLSEVIGQEHLTGDKALLPKLIEKNQFGNLIFIGPPGSGKTSLAEAIANQTKSRLIHINATTDGTKEIRQATEEAKNYPTEKLIVFIDEIHRFNKTQQDQLLPATEKGLFTLIAATTHNPTFYIIPPLISRAHIFRLNPITKENLETLIKRAVNHPRGLQNLELKIADDAATMIAQNANGDARQALNALEAIAYTKNQKQTITTEDIRKFAQERTLNYDRNEDGHYDSISAFIKSMRGSDPDATLYWLQKMLQSGEDPRYIARRMIIHASEDVGFAAPHVLPTTVAAAQALELVGMPEAEFALTHAALAIATAPKSDAITKAIANAKQAFQQYPDLPVPDHIKDNHYKKTQYSGEGFPENYLYSHDYEHNVSGQTYLPEKMRLFDFGNSEAEKPLKNLLKLRKILKNKPIPKLETHP